MLYNLIENGIRYNHEGGSVTMSVGLEMVKAPRVSERTGRIESPSQRHAASEGQPLVQKQAVVRVTDTGPGIPEEMHDKIFERFFRVDKSRSKETGGTGLGLAIVKHAVIHHGGTITVESAEGKGTTFVLRFPAE